MDGWKFDCSEDGMPFAAHFFTSGAIKLDGDTTVWRWMYFQACMYRGDQPLWIAGMYGNDCRRVEAPG